jgi:hypothetical protein
MGTGTDGVLQKLRTQTVGQTGVTACRRKNLQPPRSPVPVLFSNTCRTSER